MQFGKKSRHFLVGKFRQHQRYLTTWKNVSLTTVFQAEGENRRDAHLDPFKHLTVLGHFDAFAFLDRLESPFLILYPIHQLFALFVEPIHPAALWLLPELQPCLGALVECLCDK